MKFRLIESNQSPYEVARDIAIQNGYKAKVSSKGSLGLQYPCDILRLKAILLANGIDVGGSTGVRRGPTGNGEGRSYPEVKFVTPNRKRLDNQEKRERLETLRLHGVDMIGRNNNFTLESQTSYGRRYKKDLEKDNVRIVYQIGVYKSDPYLFQNVISIILTDDVFDYESDEKDFYPINDIMLKHGYKVRDIELRNRHEIGVYLEQLGLTPKTIRETEVIIKNNCNELQPVLNEVVSYVENNNASLDGDEE